MPRANTNLTRALTGGTGLGTEIFTSALTTGQTPTLQRAIVLDVITDPSQLTEAYKENLASIVNNGDIVDIMTPNCVIALLTTSDSGQGPENTTILFPLFPSHMMFPIAPGEQIYVLYEDIVVTGIKRGYWLSRIPGYNTFEDANYTHLDRQFDPTTNPANYSTSQLDDRPTDSSPELFQNGGNSPASRTLPTTSTGENPYDYIFKNALASRYITPEPVPRWLKRPQEFVLQGSNNSLIVLGEDRNGSIGGALLDPPIDIPKQDGNPRFAGAVDIVVGRGRYVSPIGANPRESRDDNPPGNLSTAPLIIDNSRGYQETNKNPFRIKKENIANPNEGNPDPIYDAARVYVVQQSLVDQNYKLIPDVDGGLEYPEECIVNEQPEANGALGRSYVVSKADNIRIIARREPNIGDAENIAGTILLVREGNMNENELQTDPNNAPTEPDGNLAYIYFNKEGKIQIESNKIYLGRVGVNGDPLPEPYIRYSVYKATINSLQNQVTALGDHVKSLEQKIFNAFSQATNVAPYGPVPSLISTAIEIQGELISGPQSIDQVLDNAERTKIKDTGTYIINAASTKIYGE